MFSEFKVGHTPLGFFGKYVLEVKYMHGDADATTVEEMVVEEADLLTVANFYAACEKVDSEGSGGPGYSKIPGFDEWGGFPCDATCEDIQAALEGWAVFYYDYSGVKFPVSFS